MAAKGDVILIILLNSTANFSRPSSNIYVVAMDMRINWPKAKHLLDIHLVGSAGLLSPYCGFVMRSDLPKSVLILLFIEAVRKEDVYFRSFASVHKQTMT